MAEPKFVPKPGQTDYTNIRYCPVVNTVVAHDGKILLVQRSPDMRLYPGCWNGISGFLDDSSSIEDKIKEELSEELGIKESDIASIVLGQVLLQEAPDYYKTWLVVTARAEIKTVDFAVNWEAKTAQWFTPGEIDKLDLLPGFDAVLRQFI